MYLRIYLTVTVTVTIQLNRLCRNTKMYVTVVCISSGPLLQVAILDVKQIRVSYLRSWFLLDVIAAFPIGYILFFAVSLDSSCIRPVGRPSECKSSSCEAPCRG